MLKQGVDLPAHFQVSKVLQTAEDDAHGDNFHWTWGHKNWCEQDVLEEKNKPSGLFCTGVLQFILPTGQCVHVDSRWRQSGDGKGWFKGSREEPWKSVNKPLLLSPGPSLTFMFTWQPEFTCWRSWIVPTHIDKIFLYVLYSKITDGWRRHEISWGVRRKDHRCSHRHFKPQGCLVQSLSCWDYSLRPNKLIGGLEKGENWQNINEDTEAMSLIWSHSRVKKLGTDWQRDSQRRG